MNTNSHGITAGTAALIKKAVEESGKSVEDVAQITGIPYSTLYRRVHGQTDITVTQLYAVAKATGRTVPDLLPYLTREEA